MRDGPHQVLSRALGKVYDHWMGNIQDWCISRQLWWGHRIPGVVSQGLDKEKLTECRHARSDEGACLARRPGRRGELGCRTTTCSTHGSLVALAVRDDGLAGRKTRRRCDNFYPTTTLVTGPDIIFFWVARMIMAGFEYMGEMPFKNVYFTGIIRDKQGRKMSKSLGNSPDPLDLIAKYGADALRFGDRCAARRSGRTCCSMNRSRTRAQLLHQALERLPFPPDAGAAKSKARSTRSSTSDDKWILLRLDEAIREVTEALNGYKFNEAAQVAVSFLLERVLRLVSRSQQRQLPTALTTRERRTRSR